MRLPRVPQEDGPVPLGRKDPRWSFRQVRKKKKTTHTWTGATAVRVRAPFGPKYILLHIVRIVDFPTTVHHLDLPRMADKIPDLYDVRMYVPHVAGWHPHSLACPTAAGRVSCGLDLCYTDPARYLVSCNGGLGSIDDLDHDLDLIWRTRSDLADGALFDWGSTQQRCNPISNLGVCGELGWVGFLVVCFLYKTNPKNYLLLRGKVAKMPLLTCKTVFLNTLAGFFSRGR